MLHFEQAFQGDCQHNLSQPQRVIVFTRYPEAGDTKTRLIPTLGPELASQVQEQLTKQMLVEALRYCDGNPCDVEVRFAGGDQTRMESQFGVGINYRPQSDGDLGTRLKHAFQTAFDEGTERVLAVGSDCPDLNSEILHEAIEALAKADVVIGPAIDGGYYLIGLRSPTPALFDGIDWGAEHVLTQTLLKARDSGLVVHHLKRLTDIDYPEDLIALRRNAANNFKTLPRTQPGVISVVVPTFNEGLNIEQAIAPIIGIEGVEVLVVDGGSDDATVDIARRLGATVISARPGRGRQMNTGAAMAKGDVLLFLHADSQLPHDFQKHVRLILDHGAVAGAFRLKIPSQHFGLRLIEWMVSVRSRYLQMPYGDQAIFMGAARFYQINGFPNWSLMEDVELCRRLRKHGSIRQARENVVTSARRWEELGVCKTTLINLCCLAGYFVGVSPDTLKQWYYGSGR